MPHTKEYTLAEIAELINSKVIGNSNAIVNNISTLEKATSDSISFLANKKYQKYINTTSANAVIVSTSFDTDDRINYLLCEDPYLAYAKLSTLFKKSNYELDNPIIDPSAVISNQSKIGKNVSIGANVVIGPNCTIGNNVIIKANCSIVQDVEIGASCSIDRGALDNTEIHDGVKLDNQIQIAHNVVIGKNSAIAASCAIAGSTFIGKNFQMGGLSGVLGHLSICDDVTVGAHTLITKSINEPGNYIGIMQAQKQKDWAKSSVYIKKESNHVKSY